VADIDTTFMEQVLHVPQRQRKPDVQHHRQADDLGAGFETTKWAALCHGEKLRPNLGPLKSVYLTPPDGFMADIDAALVQQVLDVAQRQRETHVHHDRQADDLGAGSEIAKRGGLAHPAKLWRSLLECKLHRLDTSLETAEHSAREVQPDRRG